MMKDPERVGNRQLLGAGAEGAEGLEPGPPRFGADGLHEIGALLRRGGCGRVRPGLYWVAFRGSWHGHELALWLQVGNRNRAAEDVLGRGLV